MFIIIEIHRVVQNCLPSFSSLKIWFLSLFFSALKNWKCVCVYSGDLKLKREKNNNEKIDSMDIIIIIITKTLSFQFTTGIKSILLPHYFTLSHFSIFHAKSTLHDFLTQKFFFSCVGVILIWKSSLTIYFFLFFTSQKVQFWVCEIETLKIVETHEFDVNAMEEALKCTFELIWTKITCFLQ